MHRPRSLNHVAPRIGVRTRHVILQVGVVSTRLVLKLAALASPRGAFVTARGPYARRLPCGSEVGLHQAVHNKTKRRGGVLGLWKLLP